MTSSMSIEIDGSATFGNDGRLGSPTFDEGAVSFVGRTVTLGADAFPTTTAAAAAAGSAESAQPSTHTGTPIRRAGVRRSRSGSPKPPGEYSHTIADADTLQKASQKTVPSSTGRRRRAARHQASPPATGSLMSPISETAGT